MPVGRFSSADLEPAAAPPPPIGRFTAQDLDVPSPESQAPSFLDSLRSGWRKLTAPLLPQISDYASRAADAIDAPALDRSPAMATVRGGLAGVVKGAGDVVAGLTSPANLAMTASGLGAETAAVKRFPSLWRALKGVEAGTGAAFGVEGAHQALTAPTIPQQLMGVAEAAGGAAGAMSGVRALRRPRVPLEAPEAPATASQVETPIDVPPSVAASPDVSVPEPRGEFTADDLAGVAPGLPREMVQRTIEEGRAAGVPPNPEAQQLEAERQALATESTRNEVSDATPVGQFTANDLIEHQGADAPRQPTALEEADHRDRAVAGAQDRGSLETEVPVEEAPVATRRLQRPEIEREIRRIAAELDTFPFVKHTFNETVGRGSDFDVVGGAAGAPVYHDIIGAGGRGTRSQVTAAAQRLLSGGKASNTTRAIEEIAKARLRGEKGLAAPWLPESAGDLPPAEDPAVAKLGDWFKQQAEAERPNPIEEFARAINEQPKVAEAPFSLSPEAEQRTSVQSDLFKAEKPRFGGRGRYALPEEGGTTLQSTIVPGAKEFAEQDLAPAMKQAGETIARAADDIRKTFAVTTRGDGAEAVGGILRSRSAEFAHRTAKAEHALQTFSRMFDRMPETENFKFIDDIEHGQTSDIPELQPVQKALRSILDERRREVQARGRLNQVIADYFPHIWKDPNQAQNFFRSLIGKRPLQGPKSFLKQRTIGTTAEGRAAGLVPVSNNPVTLTLLKVREMDKWITGHDALEDMKRAGVAKYVPVGTEAPDGWVRINDPIGTVYGNPNVPVHEAFDESLFKGLNKLAEDLGVEHVRTTKLKGGPRGAWGLSHEGGSKIQTRTGGPEQVIAHEIGHQIDDKFNLWTRLKTLEQQHKAQGYEGWSLPKELRALTDLTWEGKDVPASFKQYVRQKEEKIANMVEAYVHVPEQFKRVAPNVFDVFDELVDTTPVLQQLRAIKPSMKLSTREDSTRVGGMVVNGHWWAPAEGAQVLNQHLSPGLSGNALFDVYRAVGNTVTQAKFALSGFHAIVESINSVLSKAALAMEQATPRRLGGYGDPKGALKTSGEIVVAPIVDYLRGGKAKEAYLTKNLTGDPTTSIVDQIVQGGGRVKWDDFYHGDASKAFMTALRSGNYPGAAMRAPFALNEQLGAKMIMGHLVPRLKLGAFMDLAQAEMKQLPREATPADIHRVLGKAWDSVDNRFGELVYDNLFWPKWVKDIGQISTRALGWNVGTARELGGAAIDTAKYAKALGSGETPQLTHRMAYATTLGVIGTAFMGTILNKLYTGEMPRDVRDMIFPRTGRQTADGHEERIKLPTYAPDVYDFAHDPAHTLANKMSDLTSTLIAIAENQDRRNVEVYDRDAPLPTKAKQIGEFALHQLEPISVSNARRASADGRSPVQGMIGLSQAPAAVSRTKAEQMLYDFTKSEQPRTLAQEASREERSNLRRAVREGNEEGRTAAVDSGKLTRRSVIQTTKGANLTALQAGFKRLTLDQALRVYDVATPKERAAVRLLLVRKRDAALKNGLPPDDRAPILDRAQRALTLPYE